MFKLDSLDFQLEGLMSASVKALALIAEQAEIAHGENPALCVVDCLPGLLLERYDKSGRIHFD